MGGSYFPMNSYSHAHFAAQAEPILRPTDPEAYYWGAVAPDIRYVAKMPRSRTHITNAEITRLMELYPDQRSFLQGYLVHCMLDQIDVSCVMASRFPLRLVRKRLPAQLMAVLVEYYYVENFKAAYPIHGEHNEVLEALGIDAVQTRQYASAMNAYFSAPSWDSAFGAFQALGLLEDKRIDKYRKAAERLQRNWLLKKYLFRVVKKARLDQIAAAKFRELKVPYLPVHRGI